MVTVQPSTLITGGGTFSRLDSSKQGAHRSVFLNAGISGAKLLKDRMGVNALARFDRDALSIPGGRECRGDTELRTVPLMNCQEKSYTYSHLRIRYAAR